MAGPRRARRADGLGQDHRRPPPRRPASTAPSSTPTRHRGHAPAAPSRSLRAERRGRRSATPRPTCSPPSWPARARSSSPAAAASCCGRRTGPACSADDVTVVWLDASPAFLASRVERKAHRPLLRRRAPRDAHPAPRRAGRLYARGGRRRGRGRAVPPHARRSPKQAPRRADRRPGPRPRGRPRRQPRRRRPPVIRVEVPLAGRVVPGARRRGRPRTGCSSVLPARRAAGRRRHARPAIDARGRPRASSTGASRSADGEDGQVPRTVEELCRAWARLGPHPGRRGGGRRRRRGHRHRRLRGRRLPPRHPRRPRAHHAARPDRRRHRRQDGREPARGQEPRRRVLAAGRGAVRHSTCWPPCPQREYRIGPRRAGQVPLPQRRRPRSACALDERGRRVRAHQGRGGRAPTSARTRPTCGAGHPQLRPHARPRPRDGRPLRPAPRRGGGHRPRLRRRAGPPPRPHRRRPGGRATARSSGPTTCRGACPSGRPRRAGRPVAAATRRRSTGLTFVLDGPDGVEVVLGVDRRRCPRRPARPWRPLDDRPCCCCRGRTSTCSASGSPRSTAPPPSTTTWRPPGWPPRPTASSSSTCSPTTRASWSTPSTAPAAAARRS